VTHLCVQQRTANLLMCWATISSASNNLLHVDNKWTRDLFTCISDPERFHVEVLLPPFRQTTEVQFINSSRLGYPSCKVRHAGIFNITRTTPSPAPKFCGINADFPSRYCTSPVSSVHSWLVFTSSGGHGHTKGLAYCPRGGSWSCCVLHADNCTRTTVSGMHTQQSDLTPHTKRTQNACFTENVVLTAPRFV
jgi:hypothetical protein